MKLDWVDKKYFEEIWEKIYEMEHEIYEEVSTIEKRLEALEKKK